MIIHSPLLTDMYELTMAAGYWELGMAEQEATFNLFYRKNPFEGNYAICCGLTHVIEYLSHYQFQEDELEYLSAQTGHDGKPIFKQAFLDYLQQLKFECTVRAIPEGNVVFANEPLISITGPILQCQLVETPLVNFINYASVITTKASRICAAAGDDQVIEFGLRRAQGPMGGMIASRAAFIGGCESTSNVLAGKQYCIPARGTQAHSWIMAFENELTSFYNFAKVMQNNAIFLVDTYNTIEGVQHAIKVGQWLREQGSDLLGIRLDSGDMAMLSQTARQLLDEAGFKNSIIMASGDLDEHRIAELKARGAKINAWGVGTKLSTSYDQPSLDAAYKLGAIRNASGAWDYKIKLSETPAKTTNPGEQQVRRYFKQQHFVADVIYDLELGAPDELITDADCCEDLLVTIFDKGKLVYEQPAISSIQHDSQNQLNRFKNSGIETYIPQLESRLQAVKDELLKHAP